jgi:hypothetical protein
MNIDEALATVREVEEKEHRSNGWNRGQIVHEAFELVIKTAGAALKQPKMILK